jgi:hypothetical protein
MIIRIRTRILAATILALACSAPSLTAGVVEVLFSDGFETPLPRVTSVDYPVIAHGGRLEVTGTNLEGATQVEIGGIVHHDVISVSPEMLTINTVLDSVPVGIQALSVSTPGGTSAPFNVTVIHLLISEVDTDSPGQDKREFIEVSTAWNSPVSLDGYVVVLFNGVTPNLDRYAIFDLDDGGATSPDGLMLIGTNLLINTPDILMEEQLIQNGEDAIAIYQYPDEASSFPLGFVPAGTDGLIDALIHETGDDTDRPGLAPLLLAGGVVDEGVNTSARETASIQRCDALAARRDTTTFKREVPTPGLTNLDCAGPEDLADCLIDFTTCPDTGTGLCGAMVIGQEGNALCQTPGVPACSASGEGYHSFDPNPRVDIFLTGNLNSLETFLAPFMGTLARMRFYDMEGKEVGTELVISNDCNSESPPASNTANLGSGKVRRIQIHGDHDVWIDNLEVNPISGDSLLK